MKKTLEKPLPRSEMWAEFTRTGWAKILARVKELKAQGYSLEAIAEQMDVSKTLIADWLKGKKTGENASLVQFFHYLEAVGVDWATLLPDQTKHWMDDQVKISVYGLAGAGAPIDLQESEPTCTVYVPRRLFKDADFAVEVVGQSMYPTIPEHAVCGIKRDVAFTPGLIYLSYIPYEGHVVKRVRYDPLRDVFVFHSDNPDQTRYPEFAISPKEAEKIILGRVVWVLRRE